MALLRLVRVTLDSLHRRTSTRKRKISVLGKISFPSCPISTLLYKAPKSDSQTNYIGDSLSTTTSSIHFFLSQMAAKAAIVSRESIKPLSPTPHHLRDFKLSLLDGMSPSCYVPIVLFYSASDVTSFGTDFSVISDKLKKSLSDILTLYYPFCGRMKENSLVECNDAGVPYSEAKVPFKLSDFLQNLQISQIKELLPFDPYHFEADQIDDIGNMGIQVTEFSCGGIALGLCIMHRIADAATSFSFLNAWGAKARGVGNIVAPQIEAASLFPPQDLGFDLTDCMFVGTNIVTKRFIFNPTGLSNLRAKISNLNLGPDSLQSKNHTFTTVANMMQHDGSISPHCTTPAMACFSTTGNLHPLSPTRVEAVIALTWKASIEAAKVTSSKDQASKTWMSLPVNIRKRMVPPMSDNSLGNIWLPALTPLIEMDEMAELNDYAKLVRTTVRKVDGAYVSKFQQGDAIGISQVFLETFNEEMLTMIEDCPSYRYSSWMGFPLYETDFGWGKPTWVSTLGVPSKWYFNLLPTRSGDGIEAWVNLSEEDMQQFERNPELLQFASLAS